MAEAFYKELGGRLKAQREKIGLSQAYVASKMSPPVTRSAMSAIENGKQRLLLHSLAQLIEILGLDWGILKQENTPDETDSLRKELLEKTNMKNDQVEILLGKIAALD